MACRNLRKNKIKGESCLKKIAALLIAVFVFAVAATGCGKPTKTETESTKNQPLKIGVLSIEDNLPFYVAEAENMFTKADLKVDLVPFPSAAERDAALHAGQIDGEAADIVAACFLKKGGADVRISSITLGVTPQEGRFVLLGSPNSNFKNAKDLANVKIAVSENTIIEYVTDTLLTKQGLKKEEIQKISIPKIPIRVQMLTSNQVRAALLPDPMASLAEQQGAKVILDDTKSEINISQVVLLFRKDSIDQKRDSIKQLIKLYDQAGRRLTADPAKYRPLLIEKAKIPPQIKDTYKSPSFSPPQYPTEQDVTNVVSWMVDKKLLEKPYGYDELVDKTLIQ